MEQQTDNMINETYKDRPPRSAAIKKAISRAMRGKSNFEGKSHTKKSKEEMQLARGHDDRIQGKKWSTDRRTGKENRTYGLPDDHRWGRRRSFSRWLRGE